MVQRIWAQVCKGWLAQEPQFWEVLDQNGRTYWKVYDPASDRVFYRDSLQSVLEWVEERHHRLS